MGKFCGIAILTVVFLGAGHTACAQATAEAASATATTSTAVHAAKSPSISFPTPAASPSSLATSAGPSQSSPHLMARTGPPPDEVNRKDFEDNAGDKAGKLLLRSVPTGAEIFLNNRLVGRTPLLMMVAPGKYQIEMRGPRETSGKSTVGVMPRETQTVVIKLNQEYPTSITLR
jgi:hypothetical protein